MMERKFLKDEALQVIALNDLPMLAYDLRVDRACVPEGLYMYEARCDERGNICEVAEGVLVNFWCTLICKEPLPEIPFTPKRMDGEEMWESCSMQEYITLYEQLKKQVVPFVEPPEYKVWEVTFADDSEKSDFFDALDEYGIMFDSDESQKENTIEMKIMWDEQGDFDCAAFDSGVMLRRKE